MLAPDSLAELRGVTAYVDNGTLPVTGHTTAFDGGGGIFVYDALSIAADDNAYTVKPTNKLVSEAGRWRRM